MAKFADLQFEPRADDFGGIRARHQFANGYTASVIHSPNSYGGRDGLYEIAIIRCGKIAYDTPLTDDVLGHLSESDVDRTLQEIEALPSSGDGA